MNMCVLYAQPFAHVAIWVGIDHNCSIANLYIGDLVIWTWIGCNCSIANMYMAAEEALVANMYIADEGMDLVESFGPMIL
jgi:hypothetical protein